MKREIKFRAWHKAEKLMCPVNIITFGEGAFLVGVEKQSDFIAANLLVHAPTEGRFCKNDEFELLQFTGLKDKKGVEIYEGDIVTYNSRGLDFKGYVVSNNWEFYYEPIDKFSKDYDHMSYPPGVDIEIIGNIYENPELL